MRMNRSLMLLPALLGTLVLLGSTPAAAQYGGYGYGPQPRPQFGYRHRVHFYAGAQLTGNGVINQKTDADTSAYLGAGGGGGGLFAGVRMGPFFSLEFNWNITYHQVAETYDAWTGGASSAFHLQFAELDGKLHIPTRSPIEPFIQAGVGWGFLGVTWDSAYDSGDYIFASGPAFNLGGGLDVWLSPFLSLGGRVLYKGCRFGEPQNIRGKSVYTNFASIINVDLNATLHF